jgi:hypothetical protein
MNNLSLNELAGFDASNWRTTFRIGRARYRIQPAGVFAIKLAVKILRLSEEHRPLFSLKGEIRAVRQSLCRAALTHLISKTSDEKLRLIAIWLRGQCGGYLGIDVLAKFSKSESEVVRLKVARALHQMSGWSVLQQMASKDSSPRVRRLASPREPRRFHARLSEFVDRFSSYPDRVGGLHPMRELYIARDFEIAPPKELKSGDFIRAVLERIRLIVRGPFEVS